MVEVAGAEGDRGSASSDSIPSDEYECKICYNYFDLDRRTPRLLGCSHTFCQECLDKLHSREGRGWRIGCPVCRHRTPVPEYRVRNLPENPALTAALPLKTHDPVYPDTRTAPVVSPKVDDNCNACKQVAFAAGCLCAIFSFLSMVVHLFLGLILVHNFRNSSAPVGHVCLFVASVLALLSLILTWLMCMLRYRPEAETSSFTYLTVMWFSGYTGNTNSAWSF